MHIVQSGALINHMSNTDLTEWIAKTVAQAILDSGASKLEVSEKTGIPYATLSRKIKGTSDFTWRELLAIAEFLGLSPARFTPPAFRDKNQAA